MPHLSFPSSALEIAHYYTNQQMLAKTYKKDLMLLVDVSFRRNSDFVRKVN